MKDTIMKCCDTLIKTCAAVKSQEKVLIISDFETAELADHLLLSARQLTPYVTHLTIPALAMHGQEPPEEAAKAMLGCDVIIGITKKSMAHTKARHAASQDGARYLSLPDYSWALLSRPSLQVDFYALTSITNQVADIFTQGKQIRLTTQMGTDLFLNIDGRRGNAAPGWCFGPGIIASPPDVEANVPPIENETQGILVVDGSIPCDQIGKLSTLLILRVADGLVTTIEGEKASVLADLFDKDHNWRTRVVGEFGIGLNPKAELIGNMLEDEGCIGTVHLGIGSNIAFGGTNQVSFHLDHIIRDATVSVDDRVIMENGKLIL